MKKLSLAAIVIVMCSPLLVALGAGGASGSGWCPPGGGDLTDLDAEQSQHARTIVAVGDTLSVPERGLVVALATAAQESMLRNLPDGDRDSVGLFQQRSGWGTFAERTDPPTSATFFYTGGAGGQPGLLDIPGWQDMPITEAAQAVQRSAYPDAYAKWEDDAWLWLTEIRGGITGPIGFADTFTPGDCRDGPGGDWDGEDPPPIVDEPAALMARAQAFADASAAGAPDPFYGATHYYRLCARLAARVHGHRFSGFNSALVQWNTYVRSGVAVTDGSPPPPGALLFYTNQPHGHVAVYLGNGLVISNDVLDAQSGRRGGVYIVDADELTGGAWNLPYAGWATPVY